MLDQAAATPVAFWCLVFKVRATCISIIYMLFGFLHEYVRARVSIIEFTIMLTCSIILGSHFLHFAANGSYHYCQVSSTYEDWPLGTHSYQWHEDIHLL
jgi:hypothetical protein